MPIENSNKDNVQAQGTSLDNVVATTKLTASKASAAILDELYNDVAKHPANFLTNFGEGVAIGGVGTALLKKPAIALPVGIGLMAWQGFEVSKSAFDYYGRAAKADTVWERERVAAETSRKIGHSVASSLEMGPGLAIGGYFTSNLVGTPPLYRWAGRVAEDKVYWPVKEKLAFHGPGSSRASFVSADGQLDALGLARSMGDRHGWSGVETGQSFDVSAGRMSRMIKGEKSDISWLPGSDRPEVVTFHTHGPNAKAGARPSEADISNNVGLGIIRQDENLTFYVGHRMSGRRGLAETVPVTMRAVVLNERDGTALAVSGSWNNTGRWRNADIVHLDFDKARAALGRVNFEDPWSSLSSIPPKTDLTLADKSYVNNRMFRWNLGSGMTRGALD